MPANGSIKNLFELADDMGNLSFEFKGHFYIEPQFTGDEGEFLPAKTLLYHSVKYKPVRNR